MRARGDGRAWMLAALLGGLSAAAWLALAAAGASPWARYFAHDGWGTSGALAALCRAVPEGRVVVPAALHALAWVLMIAAMMLPTVYPLLALFRRVVAGRADGPRLIATAGAGYFAAWLAFGIAAHAADALLRSAAVRVPALAAWDWAIAAAVLAAAGAFQWTALKYRCLEACRSPFAFVAAHWHGVAPAREAWRLGLDHGLFCVGCCWALMLLMFVVGTGNLAWMLALAAVMAAEKNLRWGHRLRTPLGVALVAGAVAITAVRL